MMIEIICYFLNIYLVEIFLYKIKPKFTNQSIVQGFIIFNCKINQFNFESNKYAFLLTQSWNLKQSKYFFNNPIFFKNSWLTFLLLCAVCIWRCSFHLQFLEMGLGIVFITRARIMHGVWLLMTFETAAAALRIVMK